jgi:hypothetical protein
LSVDLSVSIRRPSKGHFKNFVGVGGGGGSRLDVDFFLESCSGDIYTGTERL